MRQKRWNDNPEERTTSKTVVSMRMRTFSLKGAWWVGVIFERKGRPGFITRTADCTAVKRKVSFLDVLLLRL